jgi:hypothetical protein
MSDLLFMVFFLVLGFYLIAIGVYYFFHPEKHSPVADTPREKLYMLLRVRFALVVLGGLFATSLGLYLALTRLLGH